MARNECGRGIDGNRKSNAGSRFEDEEGVAADVVDDEDDDPDVVEDVM